MDEELDNLDRGDELPGATPPVDAPKPADDPKPEDEDSLGDKVGEEEDEETEEERAAREAEEAEAEKKKRIRIPKARFDDAMKKARSREQELLNQIEQLKAGQNQQQQQADLTKLQSSIEELQDKYEDLILDGKKDEARKVRKQLDAARDELVELKTTAKSEVARKAAIEELKYESTLANLEAQHPELNPDSELFDGEKVDEVVVLMEAFMARGFARPTALQKAAKYVLGEPAKGKGSQEEAEVVRQRRAEEARKKAADANKRQPAPINKTGIDSDKGGGSPETVDVLRMSQEQFAKLDEATLARLRGDEV